MNILKIWLTNNSTVDLEVSDDDLAEAQTELGTVMVDPFSLYTVPMQGTETVIPGRNILFYQVIPQESQDAD